MPMKKNLALQKVKALRHNYMYLVPNYSKKRMRCRRYYHKNIRT